MTVRRRIHRFGPAAIAAVALIILLAPLALNEISWSHRDQGVGFAGDFYLVVWKPGHDVLNSRNPYPERGSDAVVGAESVYPPGILVAALPVTAWSFGVSRVLWTALLLAAALMAPLLLGVCDPRCLVLWLVSAPVVSDLMWGNATLLVVLAASLVWAFRARSVPAGIALGAGIAIKLLLLPLVLWLVFTRRLRAAAISLLTAVGITAVAWAAIGFDGIRDYPSLLSRLSEGWVGKGLLLPAFARQHGSSVSVAIGLGAIVAAALLVGVWMLRGDDARSFALVLVAVLYLTPVNHIFNFGLLLVAVAVVSPTLTWFWAIAPALWLAAFSGPLHDGSSSDLIAFTTALTGVFAVAVLRQKTRAASVATVMAET